MLDMPLPTAGCCVLDYVGDRRDKQDTPEGVFLGQAGIYFARHGVLMTVDAGVVYDAPDFAGFVKKFWKMADDHRGRVVVARRPANGE